MQNLEIIGKIFDFCYESTGSIKGRSTAGYKSMKSGYIPPPPVVTKLFKLSLWIALAFFFNLFVV